MLRTLMIATLLALASTHAAAINKCTINGRVVFQDKPCAPGTGGAIDVRPASLPSPSPVPPAPSGAAQPAAAEPTASDTQRSKVDDMRERAEVAEKERKGRELDHKIKVAQQKIRQLEEAQASEMAALARKKNRANNNLAGATWENSISKEQEAVAQKYESRMANERAKIERLEAERGRL